MAHRVERMNSLLRHEISQLLQRQVKDPRLGSFITVTGVDTSADLKYARVFISRIDDGEGKEQTLEALASASGFLRKELSKNLKLRHCPELSFRWDDSIEHGDHILQMIDEIAAKRDHLETP